MACVALSTTGGKAHVGKPAPKRLERGKERRVKTLPIMGQALRLDNRPCCDPDPEQAVAAQDHQLSFGSFGSWQHNSMCANSRAQIWETQTQLCY